MFGLILATCLTISANCDNTTLIRYDVIDTSKSLEICEEQKSREPAARQVFLHCDELK